MAFGTDHGAEGLDKMSKAIQEEKLVTQACQRDTFVLNRVTKKKQWNGCAPYEIPVKTSRAGTVSMEECLPDAPYKGSYDKPIVTGQGEIHGSLCVEERDLRCYKTINKESYISLIGDDLIDVAKEMKYSVDRMLLLGGILDQVTSNPRKLGAADANTLASGDTVVPGSLFVKCPKQWQRGMQAEITSESITTPLKVYVTSVNAQDSYVVLQTNPVDSTAAVPAVMAPYDSLTERVFLRPCGYQAQADCGMGFGSLESNLFDGADYYGVSRDSSPIFRGDNYDIAGVTPTNVIKKFSEIFYERAEECSQDTMEVLVPYKLFRIFSQELENSKERYDKDKKALVGFSTVSFCLPDGEAPVKITAVPKMADDTAWILDWSTWMFLGDTQAKDPEAPSSQPSWYRERGCNYKYFKDIYFRGKLVSTRPCDNARIQLGTEYAVCP